ncbi:YjjG family noncanonical pyrimidine nucleotidase [Paenibacillus physcomitrellae]|uniref:Noncanonical pyrimidine nucleotidase, YjjG family protein n=1 Tax=Paenibacillus physcomitrellae TaxID=1619311 RepID=A0ABQ1GJI3_9BACL|nr:YjjG family noncanonical pyrimidine nucleotidase [Paenibacillus physcomitrellae]GGA45135.1 noncanonical pyrimidine nucleotidase, YjjG family protein [Paenibacillus physcomitrellae]
MRAYTTILFDADDTLFDYVQTEKIALTHTFEEAGLDAAEPLFASYKLINSSLWRDLEQGLVKIGELRTERFRRLLEQEQPAIEMNAEDMSQTYVKHLSQGFFLLPGAVELCSHLGEQGFRMAIVTNGIREVQLSRIGGSELKDVFEEIIVSEDTGYQKPHTGFFDYAFDKLGLAEKQSVLIVGDSLTSDIQGGINYGIDTCWFNPKGLPNTKGIKPTYEIGDLSELIAIVEGGD